jgi:hypothetical protein
MKYPSLRAILLLAALACPALVAYAQSPWTERPGPVKNEELKRELLHMLEEDQADRGRVSLDARARRG